MTQALDNPRPNPPATAALILGFASIVPGVGIAAVMLGTIGLGRSRMLGGAGRSRAFGGVILGIGSLLLWAMLAGAYFQGREMMREATAATRTPQFVVALSTGNATAAKAMCTDAIDVDRLAATAEQLQALGAPSGQPQALGGEPIGHDGARVEYVLPYERGSKIVQVDWKYQNGDPKTPLVNDYRLLDPPATQPGR